MANDLTSIIVTIVPSGIAAGIVTFCMTLWKAELDLLREKTEELYASVHKYTRLSALQSLRKQTGIPGLMERFGIRLFKKVPGNVLEAFDPISL
jgi:hypothetical protein